MDFDEKPSVKYRIKSYDYNQELGEHGLLFTIEERGSHGELRQYAHEIVADENWQGFFSQDDVKKIYFAMDNQPGEPKKK